MPTPRAGTGRPFTTHFAATAAARSQLAAASAALAAAAAAAEAAAAGHGRRSHVEVQLLALGGHVAAGGEPRPRKRHLEQDVAVAREVQLRAV